MPANSLLPDPIRRAFVLGALGGAMLPTRAAPRELLVVGSHFAKVYERADGQFGGLGPEILRAIAAELGQPLHFDLVPWARAQSMVAKSQADLLVGPYKSDERLAIFAFSAQPFYLDRMVFYARAGDAFAWDGQWHALRRKRIVAINGWAYGKPFDAARADLNVSLTNSVESALAMLAHGRVDLFATNRRNTEGVIPLLGLEGKVLPLAREMSQQQGYFAFPKRPEYEATLARFDLAFDALIDSGELRRMARRLNVDIA